jgi:hypothetical protein
MRFKIKRLFGLEDGYVLLFAILILPVFAGFGLLIIDIGRGNNAHADLQSAADAVALTGAAELDGGTDSIDRAKEAMAIIENSVGMLQPVSEAPLSLEYEDVDGNEFIVVFLSDIPDDDTIPITNQWLIDNQTVNGIEAEFIYVRAQSNDLITTFFNPANFLRESVPIVAFAVAKTVSAACDIPPIYICNPFEFTEDGVYDGDQLQQRFSEGDLHGRMIRLHPPGSSTQSPGNFGFLQVAGSSGASAINDYFAGAGNATCYSSETVETKPGAAVAISQGINTRFDIYEGQYGNSNGFVPQPSENVRMGKIVGLKGQNVNECVGGGKGASFGDDHIMDVGTGLFNNNGEDDFAYGFPDNVEMIPANGGVVGGTFVENTLGAAIGRDSEWDIEKYFEVNYDYDENVTSDTNGLLPHPSNVTSAFSGMMPSRYDVHLAEIANKWNEVRAPDIPGYPAGSGESGEPMCGITSNPSREPVPTGANPASERRLIVGAIVDCGSQGGSTNGQSTLTVNSYGSFFMTRPMISYYSGYDATIDIEVVDITGFGGNGTLDEFIRTEAILVR